MLCQSDLGRDEGQWLLQTKSSHAGAILMILTPSKSKVWVASLVDNMSHVLLHIIARRIHLSVGLHGERTVRISCLIPPGPFPLLILICTFHCNKP